MFIFSSTFSDVLTQLNSNDYKNHSAFRSYLDSCYFAFDSRFLSLPFSQFYITLWLVLRRNFIKRNSILSESKSPDENVFPASRLEYTLSVLEKKNVLRKIAKNTFELLYEKETTFFVPFSFLLNAIKTLSPQNQIFIRTAFAELFVKNRSLKEILKIRKKDFCSISSLMKEDSIIKIFSNIRKNLNNFSVKESVKEKEPKTVPVLEKTVPISEKVVPVYALKYVFLNKNLKSINSATQKLREMIDRFFSKKFRISEEDCTYICSKYEQKIPEELRKNLSKENIASTILIFEFLKPHFPAFENRRIIYSIAEIILTIKNKNHIEKIVNLRAYFFQSLRNALSSFGENYPHIEALQKKTQEQVRCAAKIEAQKIENEKEDQILEDAIIAYENETGKIAFGESIIDLEFAKFHEKFREKKIKTEKQKFLVEKTKISEAQEEKNFNGKTESISAIISDVFQFEILQNDLSKNKNILPEKGKRFCNVNTLQFCNKTFNPCG